MIEIGDGLREHAVAAAAAVIGSGGILGLLGTYIRHRSRVALAREQSERTRIRTTGLVNLLPHLRAGGKIVEQDADGNRRVVRLSAAPRRQERTNRRAAA